MMNFAVRPLLAVFQLVVEQARSRIQSCYDSMGLWAMRVLTNFLYSIIMQHDVFHVFISRSV
jgi:hypothetical protein